MEYYEKLSYLMNLTSITNSRLAKKVHVDSSIISRWRRGICQPSGFTETAKKIAEIVSEKIEYSYQREELAKVSSISLEALSEDKIQESIFVWLVEDNHKNGKNADAAAMQKPNGNELSISKHTGRKGQIESMKLFREAIDKAAPGGTIRVYLDEPFSWTGIISLLSSKTNGDGRSFDSIKLMFPASINYHELQVLWKMAEPYLDSMTLHVSILERSHRELFQHAIFIAGDYAMLSSFGLKNHDNTVSIRSGQKKAIQETIAGFDEAFTKGENGLVHLEGYTIWEDFGLFDKLFTMKNTIYFYGSILNPILLPPNTLKEASQVVMGARDVQNHLYENVKTCLLTLLQTNRVYTTFPLYTPEEVGSGNACIPNIPQYVNGVPTVNAKQYCEALVYITGLYRQCDNLHILPLYDDTFTTFGVQEFNTLSIIRMNENGIANYCSGHNGMIATTARALEAKFRAFERTNTKSATLKILENHMALFAV